MHKKERWWGGGGGVDRKRHPQAHVEEVNMLDKKDELRLEVNTAILEHFIFRVEKIK